MSNIMASPDDISKIPITSVPATTGFATLNFEVEHQKQIRLLALFEDVAKHKRELNSAIADLYQQYSSANKLGIKSKFMETEIFAMEVDFENLSLKRQEISRHDPQDFDDVKIWLRLARNKVVSIFETCIGYLRYKPLLFKSRWKLRSLRKLLRSRSAAISESELLVEQLRNACKNAEQAWRSAYTESLRISEAETKNSEIQQLHKAVKDFEIQVKEQKEELAVLKRDREIHMPLAVHGTNIRSRFLEKLKRKSEREDAIIERGNATAHQGSAIADALLYDSKCLKPRTDTGHFESVYGFSPHTVLKNKSHSGMLEMVDLRGSIQSFCTDQNTSVADMPFFKTYTTMVENVSTPSVSQAETIRKNEEARSLCREMETQFEAAWAKHKTFLRNR
jgi:hypothetical protein